MQEQRPCGLLISTFLSLGPADGSGQTVYNVCGLTAFWHFAVPTSNALFLVGMWRSTPPKFYHHRADLEYQNDVGKVSRTASCNLPLGMHTAVSGRKVAGLIWIRFAFFSAACNTYLGLGSTYPGGHDDFW